LKFELANARVEIILLFQTREVADGSRERRLCGLHDECVSGFFDASRYSRKRQGDDEKRRANHGGDETTGANDGYVGYCVNRMVVGSAAGVDAAQADQGHAQNGQ
jgi:hypothetical protein